MLDYAEQSGSVAMTCRRFGISRQAYFNRLRAYERHGEAGLVNRGPCPENHALRTPQAIEEKIVHLRLVGIVLAEQDDEWAVAERRYFSVESLAKLGGREGGR